MTNEEIEELDDTEYDVEGIKFDIGNNNFSEDKLEEYRYSHQIRNSFINGQFTQARDMCRRHGFDYEVELLMFRQNLDPDADVFAERVGG